MHYDASPARKNSILYCARLTVYTFLAVVLRPPRAAVRSGGRASRCLPYYMHAHIA
jgi:hypothetical protein